jgi:hypothetical protein
MRKGVRNKTAIAKFKETLVIETWQLQQKRKFAQRCSALFRDAGYKDGKGVTATIEATDYSKDPKAKSLGTIYIDCVDYDGAQEWCQKFKIALQRRFSQSPDDYDRYHNTTFDGLIKVIISQPAPVEPID